MQVILRGMIYLPEDCEKDKLKIAIIAPIWLRVPPTSYGGIELIVSILADRLVEMGHDVTLFTSADAVTKARVISVFDYPQTGQIGRAAPDIFHIGYAYDYCRRHQFDLIHDHTFSGPVLGATSRTPVLATIHGAPNDISRRYYEHFRNSVYYNPISESQRRSLPNMRYVETVYNAIDFDVIECTEDKKGFLLSLSRICPEKGTHIAIEVADKLNRRLFIGGKVDRGRDEAYFRSHVAPRIDGRHIRYLGEVSEAQKRRLLRDASCFIFPIQWEEPFGLVLLEAMASGTPVVAFNRGAAPEVIDPGVSGYLADDVRDMARMVVEAERLDSAGCRDHAEKTFPISRMVEGYLANYYHILGRERQSDKPLADALHGGA